MDSIDRGVSAVLADRADDLHRLIDGYDLGLTGIVAEIMNRGIDSMLTDLEISEGQR